MSFRGFRRTGLRTGAPTTAPPGVPPPPVLNFAGLPGTIVNIGDPPLAADWNVFNSGGAATSWSSVGLAPGLTLDPATGIMTGTHTTAGTYNATITATNAGGSDSETFSTTVF